jgi:hypothetical protein
MALKGIKLPGFRISKDGSIVRDEKRLPVNQQIARKKSKKVRVARKGAIQN